MKCVSRSFIYESFKSTLSMPAGKDLKVEKIDFTKDISFTVDGNCGEEALKVIEDNKARLNYQNVEIEKNVCKVSVVGAGMMSNPGVAAKMFECLYNEHINIKMISTSEIRVTVLIDEKEVERAMNAAHDIFGLDD